MHQEIQQQLVGDSQDSDKVDLLNIPIACQYGNLCSNDTHRIHNEQSKWLEELNDKLPLWSRLKTANCVGYPRQMMFSKNSNYEIEIPGRLLSIFGSSTLQTKLMNKMKDMEKCQLLSNILALCEALKYDFKEWSAGLLDNIALQAGHMYPELLKMLEISDNFLNFKHLNQIYQFEGVDYKVQVQQVATGYLYIRYGVNEFNLARALTWFFHNYQFGLMQCCNRTLAFGYTLDSDYGFFMYDCQSHGFPLYENQQGNSYILRTHHLQILLYCLVMTLNVSSEMIKFFIYNVDIRILNPLEMKSIKKEIYVPTIVSDMKKIVEKKVDCGTNHKSSKVNSSPNAIKKDTRTPNNVKGTNMCNKPQNSIKISNLSTMKPSNSTTSLKSKFSIKPPTRNKTKISKSETLKIQNKDSRKEIPLDPNKMYYIISVPKESKATLIVQETKETNDKKLDKSSGIKKPKAESFKNIDNNKTFENFQLNKSDSTMTLTPDSLYQENEGFPLPLTNRNKIMVANKLSDFLTK